MKDGGIIKAEGYGFADIRLQKPATPDTIFKIASVSKQFIATGIMLLVQATAAGPCITAAVVLAPGRSSPGSSTID
jgi:beta-lactamase family protein